MKKHPLSLIGAALTTLSAAAFIFVLLMDWFGLHTNPYLGILFFFVIPGFFVLGLLLIPAGMWLARRRRSKGLPDLGWPTIDLNDPLHRRRVLLFATLTLVNLLIVSLAAFKGIEYMDTPSFCGRVCHTVMEPEYVAHQAGPHARVACTECHVGEGAGNFVKAKLNGLHQVEIGRA